MKVSDLAGGVKDLEGAMHDVSIAIIVIIHHMHIIIIYHMHYIHIYLYIVYKAVM